MAQVYDTNGTTSFQFTFLDKCDQWCVFFAQGFISIQDYSTNTRIRVNFPEEDHWTHEEHEADVRDGDHCMSTEIKNKHFTLRVDTRQHKDELDEKESHEEDSDEEDSHEEDYYEEGYLELDTKIGITNMTIPCKLALILMKFMAGSTDLKGICGVFKS